MRAATCSALTMLTIIAACSEPSAPTETFEASRRSIHQMVAIDLMFPGDGVAWDINDRDQIVGEPAGIWKKGVFQELGLPPGYVAANAAAINASGAVVGAAVRLGFQGRAFLWDHGLGRDLGLLPGDVNSEAHAINARGDIVGVSRPEGADEFNHAVLWRQGQLIALGTLPGDIGSEAWGIDDAGRVVGESRPQGSPSTWRPFMWKNGVMTELTELKQPNVGFSYTRDGIAAWKCPDVVGAPKPARRSGVITYLPCPLRPEDAAAVEVIVDIEDVNSSGQAVGTLSRATRQSDGDLLWETHGYLWSGGERFVLPTVPGQPEVSMEPHAINDRGDIVGHSSITVGATLWTMK